MLFAGLMAKMASLESVVSGDDEEGTCRRIARVGWTLEHVLLIFGIRGITGASRSRVYFVNILRAGLRRAAHDSQSISAACNSGGTIQRAKYTFWCVRSLHLKGGNSSVSRQAQIMCRGYRTNTLKGNSQWWLPLKSVINRGCNWNGFAPQRNYRNNRGLRTDRLVRTGRGHGTGVWKKTGFQGI